MTRRTFINATILLLIILPFTACKFSYEEIIDEMNSSFSPELKKTSVLDSNYNFSRMIPKEVYGVRTDKLFQLTAPDDGEWYKWKLFNSKVNTSGDENVIGEGRILSCDLLQKGFLPYEENRIELWVKVPGYPDPQHDSAIVFLITRE